YRDTVRDFWRGEDATLPALASRLTGSSDLYQDDSRRPRASVNFVTCHDGFTLRDLVSYNDKHNEANGEDNRDGESHNRSWNSGAEGDTDDPAVLALRARQQRNLLTTLLISQGVPMISHGDEIGRTQHGNNNAYCQDNETSWTDWNLTAEQQDLLDFTKRLITLRREHPVFRRRRFLRGDTGGTGTGDSVWFRPDGGEMSEENWHYDDSHALALFLNGDAITEPDAHGGRIVDDSFLILLNSHYETVDFLLPDRDFGDSWRVVVDTAAETDTTDETEVKAGGTIAVPARGAIILTSPRRTSSGRLRRALAAARRPRQRQSGRSRRD
ncbi:glycogen operon protein, partial [Streptomyces sp. DvalAA-14]